FARDHRLPYESPSGDVIRVTSAAARARSATMTGPLRGGKPRAKKPPAFRRRFVERKPLLRLLRFEVHVDGDLVADQEAASIEGFVPVDSVVLAVHGRR